MKILRPSFSYIGNGGGFSRSPGRSEGHRVRRRARGFTLIELLVVIAIIGVLASILVPAVSKALDRARMMRSLSNEKQMGMLFQQFSNDHKGILPPVRGKLSAVYGEYINYRYWFWNLYKYLENDTDDAFVQDDSWLSTIFYCPNMPVEDTGNWALGYGMNTRLSIVTNDIFDWLTAARTPIDSGKIGKPTLTTIVAAVRSNWHYGRWPAAGTDTSAEFEFYNNGLCPILFVDGHALGLDLQSYNEQYSIFPTHPADADYYE